MTDTANATPDNISVLSIYNMKLLRIVKSTNTDKKWDAFFDTGTKTSFGKSGSLDYTLGATLQKRDAFRKRHATDLRTNDPTRAGYLSYYILWGDSRSMLVNIAEYKKRFKL